MQVTCPNCGVRYAVDPLAIGPIGRTVQCVRCSHRWREKAATSPAECPVQPPRAADMLMPAPAYVWGPAAPRPSPPRAAWRGRGAATALVALLVLGLAAYIWRDGLRATLPTEWQTAVDLDAVRRLPNK